MANLHLRISEEVVTDDLFDELALIMDDEAAEVNHPFGKPDANRELIKNMDASGAFKMIVARKDGVPVGYAVLLLFSHFTHKLDLIASVELLYVDPEHRNGKMIGLQMIKKAESIGKNNSAGIINITAMGKYSRAPLLFQRMGYELNSTIYTKNIGG